MNESANKLPEANDLLKLNPKDATRFWSKVKKTDGCWLWTGSVDGFGYGKFYLSGKFINCHRLSYLINVGSIPVGQCVLHRCDVPRCVAPHHLWLGSKKQNTRDAVAKGRTASGNRHGSKQHPESRPKGEQHGQAKLTKSQVEEIRALAQSVSRADLARRFGVHIQHIGAIIRRVKWA